MSGIPERNFPNPMIFRFFLCFLLRMTYFPTKRVSVRIKMSAAPLGEHLFLYAGQLAVRVSLSEVAGGIHRKENHRLSGNRAQCCSGVEFDLFGGVGRRALEEVSSKISGVARSERSGRGIVWHGGRFSRRDVPVSRRVAG